MIRSTYTPECAGLSPYAGSAGDFNPSGFSVPPTVLLAPDGFVEVTLEENTSYVETFADPVIRLFRQDGTPIVQETLVTGENVIHNFSFFPGDPPVTTIEKLNISFRVVPNAPLFLSGDQEECTDFFANLVESLFVPDCFTTSDDILLFSRDTICGVSPIVGASRFDIVANIPLSPRYITTIQVTDMSQIRTTVQEFYCGTTGQFNLLRVAPFSCQEPAFRDWLEVLALSFSNAGLFYAVAVTSFFFCIHCGRSKSYGEKVILRPNV